jgi:hypothetical protein
VALEEPRVTATGRPTLDDEPPRAGGSLDPASAIGAPVPRPFPNEPGQPERGGDAVGGDGHPGCTAAQLRRFIRSRPFVPLHELRRRFGVDGDEDDVSPMDVAGRHLFVGLPIREASLLAELLQAGDVGYELLLDPTAPLVIGVFPMRPVPRS